MKYNCNKCETEMELKEDEHVCPECSNKLSIKEAEDLFEEGTIVGIVEDSDNLEEMDSKKDKDSDDGKKDKDSDDGKKDKDSDDDDEKKSKKDESFSIDLENIEIDVSEDVTAIFTGEELSEDFQNKAKSIFEAAVLSHVKNQLVSVSEDLQSRYDAKLAEEISRIDEDIESFLESTVEEWKKDNEIALEHGIRTEMTENFLVGLKDLLDEHYVTVPEDKYDLVDNLSSQLSEMKEKLDGVLVENISLKKSVNENIASVIIKDMSEGLADTESEKFADLAGSIKFTSAEDFKTELNTIKESYFPKKSNKGKGVSEDINVGDANNKENKKVLSVIDEVSNILSVKR